MAEDTQKTESNVTAALLAALERLTGPELADAQQLLVRRLAQTGAILPARIPAPRNITEIGGYLNLLEDVPERHHQAVLVALGLPDEPGGAALPGTGPVLWFARRPNDRPDVDAQPAIPIEIFVRSDFADGLDAARATLAARGCAVPLLAPAPQLPPVDSPPPEGEELLAPIGRRLRLVPAAALADPASDPLVLARPQDDAGAALAVSARRLDDDAPDAGEVETASWTAWRCDAEGCSEEAIEAPLQPLGPILAGAGWYFGSVEPPTSAGAGPWSTLTNVTGLVAGETRYGDEATLLWPRHQLAASSVRERLDWTWTGDAFEPPS